MSTSSPHIIVTEVPPGFLKRKNVRTHFSKFGTIVRLSIQSSYCVITFEDDKQAADAVTFGTEWKDMPMKIDFTSNHDPFGSDDALINEELNWFAEEPEEPVKKKTVKSKFETRSLDVPPKKIGRIDLDRQEGRRSEGTRLCKKHKGSKTTTSNFLEEIKNKTKLIEDSKSTFRLTDDSKKHFEEAKIRPSRVDDETKDITNLFFDSPLFSEEMTSSVTKDHSIIAKYTDDPRTRKTFVDDSQGFFRSSEERKKEIEPSPTLLDAIRKEGKSIMRTSETKKVESFPTLIDATRSDSKSILRALENKKREASPVGFDYARISGRSVQKTVDDKKREMESSPMILDYVNPEGKSVLSAPERKKRDSSPVISSDRYEKFRVSEDRRRERESSPMAVDYGKSILRSAEIMKRDSSPVVSSDSARYEKSLHRVSEDKRRERDSSPMVIDHAKSEGKSVLRAAEIMKRDSSPVVPSNSAKYEKSLFRVSEDKRRERESSPMVIDYAKSEGKSVLRAAEIKKRDFSPIVSSDSAKYEKSLFRVSEDKRRERESSPMTVDYLKSEVKSIVRPKEDDKKKRRESSPVIKETKLEESKAQSKYQENFLFSKPLEEGKTVSKSEENKIALKMNDGAIYNRVAITLQDKLDILEERDRQLRSKPEMSGIECVLQGTCPDMCPEKERILRELRNMVAPYEALADGRMDHGKAVKEYTRSSADQGKPLPHELRPQPVLSMTMSYLINCIISRIDEEEEENLHNWYDFCWGRLRAIRKDIIQQDLCDKSTVMILEQCARFHIACYDRLWGLSKSLFDDKLNTETLNNCLTSLVKCYKDLEHEGVSCPNEAEFNAYLILLNMNNGGFLLTQYQKYTRDLKKSHSIKEAVKIHLAYHNNMFSTYFKLTKNTSYLNACLTQRFFQHVRIEALNTIIKSHCTPNKHSTISVKFFMNVLKLDSVDDCVSFCESTGLKYIEKDGCFKIYRNDFYISEYIETIETPSSLVLKKRIPIAEAVVGSTHSLPILLKHSVYESFTADGIAKENVFDASGQEEKMLRDDIERKLMLSRMSLLKSGSIQKEQKKTAIITEEVQFHVDTREDEFSSEIKNDSAVDAPFQLEKTDTLSSYNIYEDSHGSSNVSTIDLTTQASGNNLSYFMPTTSLSFPKQPTSFSSIFRSNEIPDSTEMELVQKELSLQQTTLSKEKRDPVIVPDRNELTNTVLPERAKKAVSSAENIKSNNSTEVNMQDFSCFKLETSVSKDHIKPQKTGTSVSRHKPEKLFYQDPQTTRRSLSNDPEISDINPFSSKSPLKTYSPKFTRSVSLGSPTKWEKSFPKELVQKVDRHSKDKGKLKETNQFDKLRKKLSENMKKVSARKYLRLWKEKAAKLKASKELEAMVLYNMSAKEFLKLWGKPKIKRSFNLSHCLLSRKKSNLMVQIILHTDIINKIDKNVRKIGVAVVNTLGRISVKHADIWGNIAQPNPVFWKLVFALPSPPEGGTTFGMKLQNWCKEAFYANTDSRLSHAELQISNSGVPVAISVHVIEGLEKLETCSNLSALVIVRARDWETTAETEHRIEKLVALSNNPIPVAVLNVGPDVVQVNVHNETKINYFRQSSWESSKTTCDILCDLARNVHLFNIKVKPFSMLLEIASEKLLDSLRQDSFLHDGLYNAINNPNNIIIIYNQLLDKIEEEVKYCYVNNYFGTAVEFRNDLEKYQNLIAFPDNYNDKVYFEKSFSLRCLKCKLRPLKLDFRDRKELISFFKNYCDGLGLLNILKTLVRYFNLPEEDSAVKIADYLGSIQWLPFIELLVKELISCSLLTFKVAYREDVISDILESHFWLHSQLVNT